jgi:hypothetical protein
MSIFILIGLLLLFLLGTSVGRTFALLLGTILIMWANWAV